MEASPGGGPPIDRCGEQGRKPYARRRPDRRGNFSTTGGGYSRKSRSVGGPKRGKPLRGFRVPIRGITLGPVHSEGGKTLSACLRLAPGRGTFTLQAEE